MTKQDTEDRSVVVTESRALLQRIERPLSEAAELEVPLREARERAWSALGTIRAYKFELCLAREADRPIFFNYQISETDGESTLTVGMGFAAEERARLEAVFLAALRLTGSPI